MTDHIEVSSHILDAIALPLRQFIDQAVTLYGDEADYSLIRTIDQHPTMWVTEAPYTDFHFEIDHFSGNFLALSNVFDVAHGSLFADLFCREVGSQLKEMIVARINYYLDKQAEEQQAEYVREVA